MKDNAFNPYIRRQDGKSMTTIEQLLELTHDLKINKFYRYLGKRIGIDLILSKKGEINDC